jgi:hypothetical protein
MIWLVVRPGTDLGFLTDIIDDSDSRPVKEQVNEKYAYGGGWRPLPGFRLDGLELSYPGDPPMMPVAMAQLRDEQVMLYPHDWVLVVQPDGSFECSRMD